RGEVLAVVEDDQDGGAVEGGAQERLGGGGGAGGGGAGAAAQAHGLGDGGGQEVGPGVLAVAAEVDEPGSAVRSGGGEGEAGLADAAGAGGGGGAAGGEPFLEGPQVVLAADERRERGGRDRGGGRGAQGGVVAQDRSVKVLEFAAGFETVRGEALAQAPVGLERVGVASR